MVSADQIYCIIRKIWVSAQPEEVVRQRLLSQMIHQLGFPSSHLVLEMGLRQLPHLELKGQTVPKRRADLICFAQDIHPKHSLYPLLLVECKSIKLTWRVIHQVIGYNHFVGAHIIAVTNGQEIKTGWYDHKTQDYQFIDSLPSYQVLKAYSKALMSTSQ